MKRIILAGLCVGATLLVVNGLSADKPASDTAEKGEKAASVDGTAIQGTWKGRSKSDNPEHQVTFVVSGKQFDFHDQTETNNWYKGTFILKEDTSPRQFIATITECPFPEYVGKTSKAIYRIEKGALTITAYEPGKEGVPKTFDAEEAACIELTKK
ncbi:MAG TPA: hypothetical protein VLT36_23550 [Candidatus Dormibacteraeota bacterium]|nr:hypothetical protein [Candidatus Dormibacteraeota bacterium]